VAAPRRSFQRTCRRYFLWLAVPLVVSVLLMSFLNTLVNPLWLTPMPWSDPGYADYKPIHKYPRSGKAGIVRSGKWDAVLLGSSRVDIAFDPLLPQWQGKRVANLALRGGTLSEHAAMLEYASEHQKLELAIVGLDLADLTNPVLISEKSGFEDSPLARGGDGIERELRYVAGVSTFFDTLKCINYRYKIIPKKKKKAPESDEDQDSAGQYSAQGQWVRIIEERPMRVVIRKESYHFADVYTKARHQSMALVQPKLDDLHRIISLCREKNIRLILCIPPDHAVFLSSFHIRNDPDPDFRVDRTAFAKVIAEETAAHPEASPVVLWDFADFHPLNCESLPPGEAVMGHDWADGTHALPTLGKIMLSRMLDWPLVDGRGADYGMKLDVSNVDARVKQVAEGFERYKQEHPADFKWAEENVERFGEP